LGLMVFAYFVGRENGKSAERQKHNFSYPECPYSLPPLWTKGDPE
jgi:hypothetical protein